MIEAKYFKDYKHNYLILKWEEPETGAAYQSRMTGLHRHIAFCFFAFKMKIFIQRTRPPFPI